MVNVLFEPFVAPEMDNSVIGWALVPLDPDIPLEPAIAPTDVNTNE